ncbi:class A beta-lactamase [Henriciella algicola]|nr:class A beta-lactamase [Henriciella algicola]
MYSRRSVILSLGAATTMAACASARAPDRPLAGLERESLGEFGVVALEVGGRERLSHRADERFAMCSTFKWLLGALILRDADRDTGLLDRRIAISDADLVFHSPVTRQHVGSAGLSVSELCAATIKTSDNTAANLLLAGLDGPEGFTQRLRDLGDTVTRLDRLEPELNENAPGDPRDTTTPRMMAHHLSDFLFGDRLTPSARDTLRGWMIAADTGLDRLRAGLPEKWVSGDKTGTSSNRANNDVAFAIPPEGAKAKPIVIASYINVPNPVSKEANRLHAQIAKLASANR